jgi:hypothetical protein
MTINYLATLTNKMGNGGLRGRYLFQKKDRKMRPRLVKREKRKRMSGNTIQRKMVFGL